MAKYRVTTDQGVFEVTTEDPTPPSSGPLSPPVTGSIKDAASIVNQFKQGNYAEGLHQTIAAFGQAAVPALVAGVVGGAIPVTAVAGMAALGGVGHEVAESLADHFNTSPGGKHLAGDAGAMAGGLTGAKLGPMAGEGLAAAAKFVDDTPALKLFLPHGVGMKSKAFQAIADVLNKGWGNPVPPGAPQPSSTNREGLKPTNVSPGQSPPTTGYQQPLAGTAGVPSPPSQASPVPSTNIQGLINTPASGGPSTLPTWQTSGGTAVPPTPPPPAPRVREDSPHIPNKPPSGPLGTIPAPTPVGTPTPAPATPPAASNEQPGGIPVPEGRAGAVLAKAAEIIQNQDAKTAQFAHHLNSKGLTPEDAQAQYKTADDIKGLHQEVNDTYGKSYSNTRRTPTDFMNDVADAMRKSSTTPPPIPPNATTGPLPPMPQSPINSTIQQRQIAGKNLGGEEALQVSKGRAMKQWANKPQTMAASANASQSTGAPTYVYNDTPNPTMEFRKVGKDWHMRGGDGEWGVAGPVLSQQLSEDQGDTLVPRKP